MHVDNDATETMNDNGHTGAEIAQINALAAEVAEKTARLRSLVGGRASDQIGDAAGRIAASVALALRTS